MSERADFYVREARRLREVAVSFVSNETRAEILGLAEQYEALAQRMGASALALQMVQIAE
jgi:hypothetical protein